MTDNRPSDAGSTDRRPCDDPMCWGPIAPTSSSDWVAVAASSGPCAAPRLSPSLPKGAGAVTSARSLSGVVVGVSGSATVNSPVDLSDAFCAKRRAPGSASGFGTRCSPNVHADKSAASDSAEVCIIGAPGRSPNAGPAVQSQRSGTPSPSFASCDRGAVSSPGLVGTGTSALGPPGSDRPPADAPSPMVFPRTDRNAARAPAMPVSAVASSRRGDLVRSGSAKGIGSMASRLLSVRPRLFQDWVTDSLPG